MLPFSPEEFFALFERYNLTIWPAQIVALAEIPIVWSLIGSTAAILLGVFEDLGLLVAIAALLVCRMASRPA